MTSDVVIIGAGQAGQQLASSLREQGFAGAIRLIGDEPYAPYQRPPLSKSFLKGEVDEASLFMQEPDYFAAHDIEFVAGDAAVAIDREHSRVDLASGRRIHYSHLVLATGTRNRRLPCAEGAMSGVLALRTLDDAKALHAAFAAAERIVVIGAGFLGLEAATVACAAGRPVHVVEAGARALGRVASAPVSEVVQRRHEAAGVTFSFNQTVDALHGENGRATHVELSDGAVLPADLILISIGVVPNAELAAACGLEVHNGVVVDEYLLTEDAAISAIGDCASFPFLAGGGRSVRLESVQNAVDQGRSVAQRLTGHPVAYDQVPLFWSDQAGLRLQMAGLVSPTAHPVVRGDMEAAAFSVFCYEGDRLVGVESVNRLPDHMLARKLLRSHVSPSPAQAADPSFDLKALANAPVPA